MASKHEVKSKCLVIKAPRPSYVFYFYFSLSLLFLICYVMLFQVSLANGGGDSDDSNLDDSSEAAMLVAVQSKDELQLTVTKSCLDVFTKLGDVRKKSCIYFFVHVSGVLVTPHLKVPFTSVGFQRGCYSGRCRNGCFGRCSTSSDME